MSDQAALCIGGPLDGHVITPGGWLPVAASADEYTKEAVYVNGQPVIFFFLHIGTSLTAALHSVFAAYSKKGKK